MNCVQKHERLLLLLVIQISDIFCIILVTSLFILWVSIIKSLLDVICCTTDTWRYDSSQIWELSEKLSSRTFMLDVHHNRINALHQTHILIFQFGHYVWRRLFEGYIFVYVIKTRMMQMNLLERKSLKCFHPWLEILWISKIFKRFLYKAKLCGFHINQLILCSW